MENLKISIIIPTYNVGNYVEECLQSVLEQKMDGVRGKMYKKYQQRGVFTTIMVLVEVRIG